MTKTVDDLLLLIAIGVGATVIGLKSLDTEEARLRAVIEHDCPEHLDELIIALNTGMRIRIDWSSVDLTRRDLAIPLTKNGQGRHIPLNAEAHGALSNDSVNGRSVTAPSRSFPVSDFRRPRRAEAARARHWFEDVVKKAGLANFAWHAPCTPLPAAWSWPTLTSERSSSWATRTFK